MKHVNGLEGVIAVSTAIGKVDGALGKLVVRGRSMADVAPKTSFEQIVGWLLEPELDGDLNAVERLGAARCEAFDELSRCNAWDHLASHPMDFLRRALAAFAPSDTLQDDALLALGAVAVSVGAWARVRGGDAPVAPDPTLGHAEDVLRMLRGSAPTEIEARALETYLVTVTDHGMNASTFTARVIASTHSDLFSAVSGAVGALKGPLHGGAPGPVLDMLDAIEVPERADAWIRAELDAGRRIMGMGHRVYRVRDPRAAIFEAAIAELMATDDSPRLRLARAVESAAQSVLAERHPDRALRANVEFYTAVLLEALQIPRELFTPVFAIGRVAGWTAHALEQRRVGRLIRPLSEYTGETP